MLKHKHCFRVLLLTVALAHTLAVAQEKSSIDVDPFGARSSQPSQPRHASGVSAFPQNVPIYTDNFDGANDTTALKNRGYKVYYRGTGPQGTAPIWFQGNLLCSLPITDLLTAMSHLIIKQ